MTHAALSTLDDGERDLWVHALSREGGWILCGPDIASIKFGVLNGFQDHLISLEDLLEDIGHKPKARLQEHQTRKWHKALIGKIQMDAQFSRKR